MAENASAAQPKPTSSVKLVLLGEAAVGKSSLVLRFVNNEFQENKEPTIGAAFLTQRLTLQSRTIKFEIWDTAGQERFASLAPMYYRNAQAALVVYDLTKSSSLTKARHWVAELQRQANPGIVIALVGNKFDLVEGEDAEPSANPSPSNELGETEGDGEEEDTQAGQEGQEEPTKASAAAEERQRKVSTKEAKEFADEEGLLFFETSAKTGGNVHEVFAAIAAAIPETALKTARNAPGQAAQRGQQGAAAGQDERVNLNQRGQEAAKDGCAC